MTHGTVDSVVIAVTQVKADTAVEDSQAIKAIVDTASEPLSDDRLFVIRPVVTHIPNFHVFHSKITPCAGDSNNDQEKRKKYF